MVASNRTEWLEARENNATIIHHWDTDGLSSSALIAAYLRSLGTEVKLFLPPIGIYSLKDIFPQVRKYKGVTVIADYSVDAREIIKLQKMTGKPVAVYDHHLKDPPEGEAVYFNNPVAYGEDGSSWPSSTWVIKRFLEIPVNHLVVLGMAGDYEDRLALNRFPEVKNFIASRDLDYSSYVRAKDLIDVHYKLNDMDYVKKLPQYLIETGGDPREILSRYDWMEKYIQYKASFDRLIYRMQARQLGKRISVYFINTRLSVISSVTRWFAERTSHDYVMVINTGFFVDSAQIYVRSSYRRKDLDTDFFKRAAAERGAATGGKSEVAGIILPKENLGSFLKRAEKLS